MRPPSRTAAVVAAVAVQSALVVAAVLPRLSARLTGAEYLLRVAPVDPVDPFRGAYVRLSYPDLAPETGAGRPDGDVYVLLERDGSLWRGAGLVSERPDAGPYLRCRYDAGLRCGIESLFLPEDDALALERDLAESGGVARVLVDRRGNAAVVDVSGR